MEGEHGIGRGREMSKRRRGQRSLTLDTLDIGGLLADLVGHSSSSFFDALRCDGLGWSGNGGNAACCLSLFNSELVEGCCDLVN